MTVADLYSMVWTALRFKFTARQAVGILAATVAIGIGIACGSGSGNSGDAGGESGDADKADTARDSDLDSNLLDGPTNQDAARDTGMADHSAGSGGAAGSGCSSGCGPLEQCWNNQLCVAKQGSVMAADAGTYLIDVTEVTRAQYYAWLYTYPATAGQESYCTWNTDFTPDYQCMAGTDVCQGSGCDNYPVPCVNWCDAYAYCRAVGKRLCGHMGGGHNPSLGYGDTTQSQWFNACASGATHNAYPYGNNYVDGDCNDNAPATVAVGLFPECESTVPGFEGVYDLVGNVVEWEDSCEAWDGAFDACRGRGGCFRDGSTTATCGDNSEAYRNDTNAVLGFRCCSNP